MALAGYPVNRPGNNSPDHELLLWIDQDVWIIVIACTQEHAVAHETQLLERECPIEDSDDYTPMYSLK